MGKLVLDAVQGRTGFHLMLKLDSDEESDSGERAMKNRTQTI